jgi:hypothetical protein
MRPAVPVTVTAGNWSLVKVAPTSEGRRDREARPGPVGDTVTIIDWDLDPESYMATPLLSNGSKAAPLSLRPFFERYHGGAD